MPDIIDSDLKKYGTAQYLCLLRITAKLAEALQHVHHDSIVHNDLKLD